MSRKGTLFVLLALVLGLGPVLAQRTTATLRGTVSTEQGVELAGATVTATNVETGFSRTQATDAGGRFNFGDLPIGSYDLKVEFTDFKTVNVSNLELGVADVREASIRMELGAITEEITVESPLIVVETIGGEVANTINAEQITELPLNGRNFVQLTQLMPGVTAPDGLNFKNKGLLSGVDMSVSGSSVTGNQWSVDGANNNDVGANRTILVTPSVDAIEEFKIHRNSYGPEFGGAGGAQVNLVTKSGTNQFRGNTYYFYRSDSLNEKNVFLEESGQDIEPLDYEDYGFTFGGPIAKDRVHFFLSQEWNDETRGTVRSARVPTSAERLGDFSGTGADPCGGAVPVDPLTGNPFPGNRIPQDRLSEAGLEFLNLYPQPNQNATGGACNNWIAAVPTGITWEQTNGRVDAKITEGTRALVRYTKDQWENSAPNAGSANGLWGDDPFPAVDSAWDQPGESFVAQLNSTIRSKAVNTLTFSYSGNSIDITRGEDGGLNSRLNQLIPSTFPESGKTNGAERSHPVYWGGATGLDLWNIAPWTNEQDLLVFKDDYQQVFGDHWLKIGALYSDNSKAENCCGASAAETPHFWGAAGVGGWGATSGNRIADILIDGMYHGYDESAFEAAPEMEWQDIEVYVGDSWTLNSNMTLDYGVRYSRYIEPYAVDDNIVAFYPDAFNPALGDASCNGVAQVPGTDPCGAVGLVGGVQGVDDSFVSPDEDNFAPRIGFAWNLFGDGDSVFRAGFGQYYQRERVNIQLDFANQPPFVANTSGARALDEAPALSPGYGVPNRGIDPDNETPYNLQWNLTWEQRLAGDSSLEISYVGNRGRNLVAKVDINQVPDGDFNGNGINDRLDFLRGGGDGNGAVRPYFSGGANRILYWQNTGRSDYDALQLGYRLSFGEGSLFQASYTYSDFKADTSVSSSSAGEEASQITDLYNDLDYGPADLHRDHVFNSTLVWNLPTFEGAGGFKEWVLGHWTIGNVVAYSSGTPVTVYVNSVPGIGGGGIGGTGYANNARPLQVGSCGGSGSRIFDADAFTVTGMRLGDTTQYSGRGQCEGPDFFQWDLSFYKNIPLGNRFRGQLRIEVFNVTNQANYVASSVANSLVPFNVVYNTGDPATATSIVASENPGNFGVAGQARDPRQVQLGFKLSF